MRPSILRSTVVLTALATVLAACQPATLPATPQQAAPAQPQASEPTAAQPPKSEPAPTQPQTMEAPVAPTEFPRNETLYVTGAAWGPPNDWNPFITWSKANTSGVIGLVYETLFGYNPLKDELIPWLAESGKWTSPTTFELVLREGLTWTDGKPLTTEDVKFTFELGKKYAGVWFNPMWKYLKDISVTDDRRMTFSFTEKPLYQEWTHNLYNIAIVPKHLWENRTEEEIVSGKNEKPIGSGAYLYLTHGEDRNVWVRNENWWGIKVFGKPAPKYIVDMRFSGNNIALGAVIKGDVDLSNNFLPGVATLVENGYVKTYFSKPPYMLSANTAVLFLNTTIKPLDDPAFRRALAFAIDVPSIVRVAFADLVKPASPSGLLPHLSSKYDDQDVIARLGFSYDPEKAKQLLAEAGYKDVNGDGFVEAPDGSKIELEATCPNGWTDWMAAIEIIASSAQKAGINIKAAFPDYGAWNTALTQGTFNMTLNNWAGMSNTPWTLYNLLFSHPIGEIMGGGNFGRYNNQTMFDLVDELASVPADDEAGVKAVVSKIQELMLKEMPVIPLWYNGLWAQFNDAVWTNWPTADSGSSALPSTWSGYWQMGGLQTLIELKPKASQ